ncbi:hypothetical protein DPEC_G00003460 [Dallia pectoralis]|uniref:Uncharacterized protein n=1 Tax=Dallia pectoralis TaxID=75939 RepID=A0ACC2HJE3_DALPE|nr:hypothetical protein DPEC_G00003460 [Dallia pectoralis]
MIDRPIVLRRNTKIANVHPCLALEELDFEEKNTEYLREGAQQNVVQVKELNEKSKLQSDYKAKLGELGLTEIDIESCEVGDYWKEELTDLIVQYESSFSRDKLDCGEVKNTVHRIRLKDENFDFWLFQWKKIDLEEEVTMDNFAVLCCGVLNPVDGQ